MDDFLKNTIQTIPQDVKGFLGGVGNVVNQGVQGVEHMFQPQPPIQSPIPQSQSMVPQPQPNPISQDVSNFVGGAENAVGNLLKGAGQYAQGVEQRMSQIPLLPNFQQNFNQNILKPAEQFSQGFSTPATQEDLNKANENGGFNPYSFGNFIGNDVLGGSGKLIGEVPEAGKNAFSLTKGLVGAGLGAATTTVPNLLAGKQISPQDLVLPTLTGFALGVSQGGSDPLLNLFKAKPEQVAQQAAEDIHGEDPNLLNHEAIAPYKRALSIKDDTKTQSQLVNAISDIKTNGMIGDEDANNIINMVSQKFLPKGLTDRLNSVQLADTWEYLLARVNGRVPETVPSWMQNFDNAIFDISGKKALQAGKINFGAKIGQEAPLAEAEQEPPSEKGEQAITMDDVANYAPQLTTAKGVNKVQRVLDNAETLKSQFDQDLQAIADDNGADFKSRIKSMDSSLRKITQQRMEGKTDYNEKGLNDPYGARIVIKDIKDEPAVIKDINDAAKDGQFEILKSQPVDKETYHAYHVDIQKRLPDGKYVRGEIQIHTPQSLAEAVKNHPIRSVFGENPPEQIDEIKKENAEQAKNLTNDEAMQATDILEQKHKAIGDVNSLKDELSQPPLPPKMSSKAIREGLETPITGRDISVSPQAAIRFKNQQALNPEDFYLPESTPFDGARESLPPRDEANIGIKGKGSQSQKVDMGEGSNNLLNKLLNPLKNLPKELQDATEKWKTGQDSALVNANNTNLRVKELVDKLGITPKQEWALVNYSQNPTPEFLDRLQKAGYDINQDLVDKAKPLLDLHRQLEDQRFNKTNSAGIATKYKENHLYQDYANTPQEIEQALQLQGRGLNKKPGFTFKREIPTYLDAQQIGLQPKYSTFGQINANAEHELGKSIANKDYASFLKDNNRIVPSSQAPQGWKAIQSDNFPRDPETGDHYYASPKDAEVINNIFGGSQKTPVQQLLQFTGNLSEKLQSLKLTTPGLSIHGFSIANIVRDQAMALGDAITGHPIRAMRTSGSGIMSALRAFVPGAAEDFEREHAYSIKQMADNGLGYSGKQDYRNMQENVGAKLSTKILDSGKDIENMIVTDPTFRKFMYQRKVSLFENFRDSLQSQGYSPEDAAKTAADQLRSYDGVVNDLGRSPDVKNFLRTFFFAPKYRESIVGSQFNAVKGLLNPANKDYDFSRRLALGMGVTFLAYNALNMKFNGKPMWQNPAGHEFDLAIPDPNDKTKNYYIPFMPGTTAVPRAVAGTGIALAQGDTDTAGKEFSGLLSSPIQTGIEAFGTKQDYFGRPLFDNTKPLLPQQLGYTIANTILPSSLNEVNTAITQAKQGKLNLPIEAARVLQLPIKEGTIPNPFFSARDSQLKTLPLQLQQAYGALQAVSTMDPNDPTRKQVETSVYKAFPQLFDVNKNASIAAANGDMSKVDPLYSADLKTAKEYLEYQQLYSTAEGSTEEKQYLKNHPEVQQLIQDRSKYFANNPIPQKPGATPYIGAPQASAYVQQQLAAKNYNDPQVQQYLSQHLDYVNQQRAKNGLDPIDQYGNIQGSKNYGIALGSGGGSIPSGFKRALTRESSYIRRSGNNKVKDMIGKMGGNYEKSYKKPISLGSRSVSLKIGPHKGLGINLPKQSKSSIASTSKPKALAVKYQKPKKQHVRLA